MHVHGRKVHGSEHHIITLCLHWLHQTLSFEIAPLFQAFRKSKLFNACSNKRNYSREMWKMLLLYTKHSLFTIQQTSEFQHVMQACRRPTFHNTTTERSNSETCVDRERSTTPHTVQCAVLIIRCNEHALLIKSVHKAHQCQLQCVESTPQLSTCHSDFLFQAVHWSR